MALPPLLFGDWTPWVVSGAAAALVSTLFGLWLVRRNERLLDVVKADHERAAAEERRRSAALAGALDAVAEGVVVADAHGGIVAVSAAARRIVGGDGEAAAASWPGPHPPLEPDGATPLEPPDLGLAAAARGEDSGPRDACFPREGGVVHVRAGARPLRDRDGAPIGAVLVLRDTTADRGKVGEREALIEDLGRRNKELERFTYTVSHELRSPLVTIKGFLGLLRKDAGEGDMERLAQDMERIGDAVEAMTTLLEDLLELSRAGVVVSGAGTVDLAELVDEVVRSLEGPIRECGAEVVVAPDLPTIRGDRRLFEVFQNLVENALKFMGDQPAPRIDIGARPQDAGTVCFVRDNGIGIEPDAHERVFRVFERLDPTVEGTGVGLALVKGIVEAHRGTIWVESEGAGHGSTFYFSIPRHQNGP